MECRSCHKHTLLQVWCGLLTACVVIMAAFLSSIKPKSEDSTLKQGVFTSAVSPRVATLKSNGTFPSYIELIKSLRDSSWQEHLACEFCSLRLQNNSIYCTHSSLYFIYAQVTFRKHNQTKSVMLIRNPAPGKQLKLLVEVPAPAGNSVWVARVVKLTEEDSVSLNITGEFCGEGTFWGAFQLH